MLGRPAEQSHMLETPTHSTLPSFWLENVAEPRVNADYLLDCSGILMFPSTGQIAHSRKRKKKKKTQQEDACLWDSRSEAWMLMKRQVSALWDKFIFLRDWPGMRNKVRLPWVIHRTICIMSSDQYQNFSQTLAVQCHLCVVDFWKPICRFLIQKINRKEYSPGDLCCQKLFTEKWQILILSC